MDYVVAIPSYQRANILNVATLPTLVKHGVDLERVTVWTATDDERKTYERDLAHKVRVQTARPGLLAARQLYHQAYPPGTRILNLDDDIYNLLQKDGDSLRQPDWTVDQIVAEAFTLAEKTGSRIWGLNPVSNGWFMRDHVTVGLRYICGIFFGSYAGDTEIASNRVVDASGSGEDFELSIKSFIRHGATIRLEFLTPVTKYFAQGGIHAELAGHGIERADDHLRQLHALQAAYPDHCTVYTKAGGVANLRLKRVTHARVPLEALK